jgi:hypothetical protein
LSGPLLRLRSSASPMHATEDVILGSLGGVAILTVALISFYCAIRYCVRPGSLTDNAAGPQPQRRRPRRVIRSRSAAKLAISSGGVSSRSAGAFDIFTGLGPAAAASPRPLLLGEEGGGSGKQQQLSPQLVMEGDGGGRADFAAPPRSFYPPPAAAAVAGSDRDRAVPRAASVGVPPLQSGRDRYQSARLDKAPPPPPPAPAAAAAPDVAAGAPPLALSVPSSTLL